MVVGPRVLLALTLGGLSTVSCAGSDDAGACSAADGCVAEQRGKSLLGAGAMAYSEAREADNTDTAEPTGYVLETEEGLGIEATFEGTSPTSDAFVWNSGEMGTAQKPGFPGVNIQVVVDGVPLDTGVSLSLDTMQEFGYSALTGAYFKNAALISGKDYVLRVTPGPQLAGKSYTLEVRGNVPTK